MAELTDLTIAEARAALAKGETTSAALTEAHVEAVAAHAATPLRSPYADPA